MLPNPRREAESNDLIVSNEGLKALGLKPTTLENGLLDEIMNVAKKYRDRVDTRRIVSDSFWNAERKAAVEAK